MKSNYEIYLVGVNILQCFVCRISVITEASSDTVTLLWKFDFFRRVSQPHDLFVTQDMEHTDTHDASSNNFKYLSLSLSLDTYIYIYIYIYI